MSNGLTPASGSFGSCNFETDSDILKFNRIFWKRRENEETSKENCDSCNQEVESGRAASKGSAALNVWRMAKEIGVSGKEDDVVYIRELQMMEERDHQAKVMRGGKNSVV